jgi:hypothetical protein
VGRKSRPARLHQGTSEVQIMEEGGLCTPKVFGQCAMAAVTREGTREGGLGDASLWPLQWHAAPCRHGNICGELFVRGTESARSSGDRFRSTPITLVFPIRCHRPALDVASQHAARPRLLREVRCAASGHMTGASQSWCLMPGSSGQCGRHVSRVGRCHEFIVEQRPNPCSKITGRHCTPRERPNRSCAPAYTHLATTTAASRSSSKGAAGLSEGAPRRSALPSLLMSAE